MASPNRAPPRILFNSYYDDVLEHNGPGKLLSELLINVRYREVVKIEITQETVFLRDQLTGLTFSPRDFKNFLYAYYRRFGFMPTIIKERGEYKIVLIQEKQSQALKAAALHGLTLQEWINFMANTLMAGRAKGNLFLAMETINTLNDQTSTFTKFPNKDKFITNVTKFDREKNNSFKNNQPKQLNQGEMANEALNILANVLVVLPNEIPTGIVENLTEELTDEILSEVEEEIIEEIIDADADVDELEHRLTEIPEFVGDDSLLTGAFVMAEKAWDSIDDILPDINNLFTNFNPVNFDQNTLISVQNPVNQLADPATHAANGLAGVLGAGFTARNVGIGLLTGGLAIGAIGAASYFLSPLFEGDGGNPIDPQIINQNIFETNNITTENIVEKKDKDTVMEVEEKEEPEYGSLRPLMWLGFGFIGLCLYLRYNSDDDCEKVKVINNIVIDKSLIKKLIKENKIKIQ